MKPASRTLLAFVPLVLQFLAAASAYAMTSIFSQSLTVFMKEYPNGRFPRPSLLLANHPGLAKLTVVGLFAISAVSFFISRTRMKNESDQLAFQGTVFGVVWFVGSAYVIAITTAALIVYSLLEPMR